MSSITFSFWLLAITRGMPLDVAISAALIFVFMPPLPSRLFPSISYLSSGVIVSTVLISFAPRLFGWIEYSPSTLDRMMMRFASRALATRTDRMSLSLKFTLQPFVMGISSSVDVTSFSLMIGTMPSCRVISRTLQMWR